jgi:hypothetical protein
VKIARHVASGGDIPYLLVHASKEIFLDSACIEQSAIANLTLDLMNFNSPLLFFCTHYRFFHHLSA